MSGARAPPASCAAGANKPALFAPAVLFTVPEPLIPSRHPPPIPSFSRSPTVFSLLGVIGITLVLLLVVVLTAGLILGK